MTLNAGGIKIKFKVCAGSQNMHDLAKVGTNFLLHSSKGSSKLSSISDIPV